MWYKYWIILLEIAILGLNDVQWRRIYRSIWKQCSDIVSLLLHQSCGSWTRPGSIIKGGPALELRGASTASSLVWTCQYLARCLPHDARALPSRQIHSAVFSQGILNRQPAPWVIWCQVLGQIVRIFCWYFNLFAKIESLATFLLIFIKICNCKDENWLIIRYFIKP